MRIFSKTLEERRDMILNGNTAKTMMVLSIPTILMNLVQSMVPLTDSYFFNNYGGYLVASGVTFSQPIINTLNGTSIGLGIAAAAIIGQLYGKGDIKGVKRIATQVICLAFILGVVMSPLAIGIAYIIQGYIDPELSGYVFKYLSLYSLVLPFLFLTAIYNAIKNSTGEPEATFIRIVILLILKVIFNAIFLTVLKLGILGAVLASLLSYILIGVWMFYDLFIKETELKLDLRGYRPDKKAIKEIFHIGIPSMLNYILVFMGFILINMDVQEYGAKILNANGVASNISVICFALPNSLATTITAMVSINIGNGNVKKSKGVYKLGNLFAMIIALIMVVIFFPVAKELVGFFLKEGSDKIMVETSIRALKIYVLSIFGFNIFTMAQAVYVALGRTKLPLLLGILRIWGFRYIFILATKSFLGVDSVFWGNLVSNLLAGLIFAYAVKKLKWKSVIDKDAVG